jgi:hypothetical protein
MTRTRTLTVLAFMFLAPRLAAADAPTPAALVPCVFAHDELLEALGLDVEPGQVADMQLPGGRDVGCLYRVKDSDTVLTVRQTWDPAHPPPPSPAPKARREGRQRPRSKADPAAAGGQPDEPSVELVYWRGKVHTRLFVHGPALDPNDMDAKLHKLRQVP